MECILLLICIDEKAYKLFWSFNKFILKDDTIDSATTELKDLAWSFTKILWPSLDKMWKNKQANYKYQKAHYEPILFSK